MIYRTLGKTGVEVSAVGVGTWQLGGEWGIQFKQSEVDEIFDAAKECGINLIDTAECYGDHLSEQLIGRAIERTRSDWFIATKFGHHFCAPFNRTEPRAAVDVMQQLEDSLTALRTDYIDLYQYHSWGDDQVFNEDVQTVLLKAREQGKVRFLGNSVRAKGDSSDQIRQSSIHSIDAIQIVYNRLRREAAESALPICLEQNLGVLARVPLASGYLSGKYKPGHRFDENEMRGHWHDTSDRDQWLAEVEKIQFEEVPAGVDMANWAVAWCLRHPAVTCVIPGVKTAQQVRANAQAIELVAV